MLSRTLVRLTVSEPMLRRSFRPSLAVLAKKTKGKGGDKDDDGSVELPDLAVYNSQMKKVIASFKEELIHIRAGTASTDMLSNITVTAFGAKLQLPETGQIALRNPTALTISVFDTTMTQHIVTAIRDAGMNLSPLVEGNTVVVHVPKPSKETREMQIKSVGKMAESVGINSSSIKIMISRRNRMYGM